MRLSVGTKIFLDGTAVELDCGRFMPIKNKPSFAGCAV